MRIFWISTAVAALTAGAACAGGVDRSGQSTDVLFAKGRHLEFTLATVNPKVSGVEVNNAASCFTPFCLDGQPSGNMAPSYTFGSVAYKADLSPHLAYALILDQPYGADVDYPAVPAPNYYASGASAKLRSTALTALLKYRNDQNISFFGGARIESMEAQISVPFIDSYQATGRRDWKTGYVLGLAWEKPEIAARISLTYSSAITHKLDTTESTGTFPSYPQSTTDIVAPQSVNLSFQTGIAADTLLFGEARWVEWSKFVVAPELYYNTTAAFLGTGVPIVAFDNNRVTYSLGLGRRLSDTWSVAGTVGYEETLGGISSNLSPRDGFRSVGLGATYSEGNYHVTFGLKYLWIGNADTQVGPFVPAGHWRDNTGVAAAIKVALDL